MYLNGIVYVVLISILIGIGYVWFSNQYGKFQKNWDVIQFAMEKPEFVRALKNDYASKSAELEKDYMKKELTPEQELAKTLVDQVKGSK